MCSLPCAYHHLERTSAKEQPQIYTLLFYYDVHFRSIFYSKASNSLNYATTRPQKEANRYSEVYFVLAEIKRVKKKKCFSKIKNKGAVYI